MPYLLYYLFVLLLTYASRRPWVMLGVVVLFLTRPVLPDPWVLFKTIGRIRALENQIEQNPANVTARRDLAELWLERLRPKRALELLDEARKRDPEDAELLYLTGVARLRSGDAEGSLEALVSAVDIDPRVRFGDPYIVAAEALLRLDKLDLAEDALERFVKNNSSSVRGYVWLAQVRKRTGNVEGARAALDEAVDTWRHVPRNRRTTEFSWWIRAHFMRLVG